MSGGRKAHGSQNLIADSTWPGYRSETAERARNICLRLRLSFPLFQSTERLPSRHLDRAICNQCHPHLSRRLLRSSPHDACLSKDAKLKQRKQCTQKPVRVTLSRARKARIRLRQLQQRRSINRSRGNNKPC